MVLVFAYTSFETFFRARDLRFIATLPIRGATRYVDLLVRAWLLHLPLLLPVGLYALALARHGAGAPAAYAAAVAVAVYVVGVPLCTWLHLLAGRTLLTEGSRIREQLAGSVFDAETALLVYAPAAGLTVTLVLGIFLDLALRDALIRGDAGGLAPVLGGALAVAAFAVFKGRALADASLHLIVPRFLEVDVPAPFRDDGVKKRIPGESLARLLPPAARPHFTRDLRQVRRRFRLDRVLLWIYAAALLRLDVFTGDAGPASLGAHMTALALFVGLFLVNAFRVRGRELASPWLDRALPAPAGAANLGRLAADAIYPLWALLLTVVAVVASGRPLLALATAGLGLALCATLLLASHALAARAFPTWVAGASVLFRGVVVGLAGVSLWLEL